MRRAKARGMDPNRALDLGIAIIVSALIGASCCWSSSTSMTSATIPASCSRSCVPGRLLRRPDCRHSGGVLVNAAPQDAPVADDRHLRARYLVGPRGGPPGVPGCWAAATAIPPTCRGQSRLPTRRPQPTSARRSGCRCIPRNSTRTGTGSQSSPSSWSPSGSARRSCWRRARARRRTGPDRTRS